MKMFRLGIPLWLLWIALLILSFGGYALYFSEFASVKTIRLILIIAPVVLVSLWLYLSLRLFRFQGRLRLFFRRLLANDYSTGIRNIKWLNDELTKLTDLINRTADQLRTYDELRTEKTGLSYRSMDLLFRNSEKAIILADLDKKQFRLNPAAQEIYNVKQEVYSFSSIMKQEANVRFVRSFMVATLRDQISKDGTAIFKLPQKETAYELIFRLEPLKNNSEKVKFAFLFIKSFNKEDDVDRKFEKSSLLEL
jgi:PAS domain-containing protein